MAVFLFNQQTVFEQPFADAGIVTALQFDMEDVAGFQFRQQIDAAHLRLGKLDVQPLPHGRSGQYFDQPRIGELKNLLERCVKLHYLHSGGEGGIFSDGLVHYKE